MEYLFTLVLGALAGFLARWYMLRRDYRRVSGVTRRVGQFTSSLGLLGGLIGAVIVPALMERFSRSFLSAVSCHPVSRGAQHGAKHPDRYGSDGDGGTRQWLHLKASRAFLRPAIILPFGWR